MREIIAGTLGGLLGVIVHFFQTVWDELVFPPHHITNEEYLKSKVKDQYGIIRTKDGNISYLQGQMREHDHTIRDRDQLLTQKDKELEDLRKKIQSLEWRLREERTRNKRRR